MSGFTRARLSTNLETQKIKANDSGDWKQLNDYLMKENTKIASFLSLVKKGHQIEKEILDAGGSREKVISNLKRITARPIAYLR